MSGGDSVDAEVVPGASDQPVDGLVLDSLELEQPIVVPSDATVQTVAQAMWRAKRSTVVVGPWTVVTERDIARAVAHGRSPTTPAAAIAGQTAAIVSSHTDVVKALATMLSEHVTEVVVTDGDLNVTGILTLGDAVESTLRHADTLASVAALREALGVETRRE